MHEKNVSTSLVYLVSMGKANSEMPTLFLYLRHSETDMAKTR